MGTKNNPGRTDCYSKALPDEPMFVLLARDEYAPTLVQYWANQRAGEIMAGARSQDDWPMIVEAMNLSMEMVIWRQKNNGSWRTKDTAQSEEENTDELQHDHSSGEPGTRPRA